MLRVALSSPCGAAPRAVRCRTLFTATPLQRRRRVDFDEYRRQAGGDLSDALPQGATASMKRHTGKDVDQKPSVRTVDATIVKKKVNLEQRPRPVAPQQGPVLTHNETNSTGRSRRSDKYRTGLQKTRDDLAHSVERGEKLDYEPQAPKMNVPINKPGTIGSGFWGRTRLQPINPQFVPHQTDGGGRKAVAAQSTPTAPRMPLLPRDKPTRMRNGEQPMHGRNRDKQVNKLSDSQCESIMNEFALNQWYSAVWKKVAWIDIFKVRAMARWAHVGMSLSAIGMFGVVWICYLNEIDLFDQMEPEEQRDWLKVIHGMRMSKIKAISDAVLDRVDPLRVMPAKQQMTCIVQEFRDIGMVDRDWELEQRDQESLIRHPDFYHFFYWTVMYMGRMLTGGGMFLWNPNMPV
jgi:hypothetical protein